ncbi:amidase signature domain-containing protein [Pyrenochaeta sp. MPI-SDFR-AT-0127]|nr:amidase signature domain-containing protein [Pyrenochaeta sp. MPI-SDFR-AT-0127]
MMSVTLTRRAPYISSKVPASTVKDLTATTGLRLSNSLVNDFCGLLEVFEDGLQNVFAQDHDLPVPDLSKYPRTDIHIPANEKESDKGGWATRFMLKSMAPKSKLLEGCTVAIKDNVAVAGVRCTNGTKAIGEWTPEYDATVITRILDAGAVITGKAACENACMECVSDTSCTGPVHNPYADGYSCGGSSSGSGRLVGSGAVDMAIGCDQAGSIRLPSSSCGLVGLKPTWGLVPYSGILGLEARIDHCGPMTKTVGDNALFLEVIAGRDGIDDRQPSTAPSPSVESLKFSSLLGTFLSSRPISELLKGFRIGVLKEGFALPEMESNVSDAVRSAISDLASLGAEVVDVSIPIHTDIGIIGMCTLPLDGAREDLFADITGRMALSMIDHAAGPKPKLSQEAFDALGPSAQNLYMWYLYITKKYGAKLHAKGYNLLRKCSRAYDATLADVDVLIMPTLPKPPGKILQKSAGTLEYLSRSTAMISNTSPFNSTGHPALTLPVGFVPAVEDPSVKLPVGMQIVGKQFGDLDCLKVAAAWESKKNWKECKFGC